MRAVEARRFRGGVGWTAASAAPLNASSVSSMWGSVLGVRGETGSEEEV